jgi:site-specific DNA-cytosine methylase
MRVLIACEESQEVCKAFRKLGFEAFSCDILPCSGGHPEWHLQQDVLPLLEQEWDMIIAFPPCTHLAVSGARHFKQKIADGRQQEGIDFFMNFANCKCERVAIENPIGIMSSKWKKPSQIIHPWQFGHEAEKNTCLWLKNLPLLTPTNIVGKGEIITYRSGKKMSKWYANLSGKGLLRSKTFSGIAKAMAEQWGEYLTKLNTTEELVSIPPNPETII